MGYSGLFLDESPLSSHWLVNNRILPQAAWIFPDLFRTKRGLRAQGINLLPTRLFARCAADLESISLPSLDLLGACGTHLAA